MKKYHLLESDFQDQNTRNHYQHPFVAVSISSPLKMNQQVLVLNRCSFNPFYNEKGEKYSRVMHDKENWQPFSHIISSVILHLPCQKNNPDHQNNHFLRLTPQLYSCPKHTATLEPQNAPEDLYNIQIILGVHHLSYIQVLSGVYGRSVEIHCDLREGPWLPSRTSETTEKHAK